MFGAREKHKGWGIVFPIFVFVKGADDQRRSLGICSMQFLWEDSAEASRINRDGGGGAKIHSEERTVFSINCAGKTKYPHA